MAETKKNWIHWLAWGVLGLWMLAAMFSQLAPAQPVAPESSRTRSGSIAGRLTDLNSSPLAGVSVTLRNQTTGAEFHTATAKNGVFRFPSIEAGEYTLVADAAQLGHGSLEGILVSGGSESRLQAAIDLVPAPLPALALPAAAQPRMAAAQPRIADAQPAVAHPLAATAFIAPHPEIGITSPPYAASIDAPPMLLRRLPVLRAVDAARPAAPATLPETNSPRPVLQSTAPAVPPPSNAPAIASPALRRNNIPTPTQRAPLETQPAAMQIALAEIPQRIFPLRPVALSLPATLALPISGLQSAPITPPSGDPAESPLPAAELAASALASTTTARQIESLPASGGHWAQVLFDLSGTGQSSSSDQITFRGSPENAGIPVDGANTHLAFGAVAGSGIRSSEAVEVMEAPQEGMSRAWNGGRGFGISETAIREVTAAAGNVEADRTHLSGGLAGIRTESGGNRFHGRAFLFDRQNTWGARNPFTQWVQNSGTAASPNFTGIPYTPPDHETALGIGAGGPIRRDRLFWYAALDSSHRNDPALSMLKHPDQFFAQPSNAQMQLLSAQLGLSSVDPVSEGLAAYWSMMETLAGLLGPAPRSAAQWTGFARIDWKSLERHRLSLEGVGANSNATGGGFSRQAENRGSHSFGSREESRQWLLARWETHLKPNLLALTQLSVGRTILRAPPETPSAFEQTFLAGNAWGQLPQIAVDSRYGFTIGNPARYGQGSWPDERIERAQQSISWSHRTLLLRSGVELDHDTDAVSLLRNQTGSYHYSKVENFAADALVFGKYGLTDALDNKNPHNCDATGKAWRTSTGQLMGLGALPCYSYYTQTIGPASWRLDTNDCSAYATAQWHAGKWAILSAGLRWERQQMPPPIAALDNPALPFTEKMPRSGNDWGPRAALAIGNERSHWPVLRLGYGMYFARVHNATLMTALTHTGSANGDLNYLLRPQDDCQNCSGGAPPFPYVLAGRPANTVKPGVVGFAPNFHNPEVHQAVAAVEQRLPGHVELTASALLTLGRRLPVTIDTNIDSTVNPKTIVYSVKDSSGQGPIHAALLTVPFYATWPYADCIGNSHADPLTGQCGRLNPDYNQIAEIASRANSTSEAATIQLVRNGRRGLSFRARYTYAHAMDWNPDGVVTSDRSGVLDPAFFNHEYGASDFDQRHSAAVAVVVETPWTLHGLVGRFANGWRLSGIGQFHSGLPYTMRATGSIPKGAPAAAGNATVGLGPGINGYGGESRVYGFGSNGQTYSIGRNTFRYPSTWKADLRLAKHFDLGERRQVELLVESFNLFNHQNVTALETVGYSIENGSASELPTLNFLTGLKANTTAFGQPLGINTGEYYRERQIQIGLRFSF